MNGLGEIKTAAAKLDADDQMELFRWLADSEAFKKRQLAALKRDLALGLEQLGNGHYKTYDDSTVMQLAEETIQRGRERLKAASQKQGE